jgi:alpha-ketoglutarate-dependent taurine dioxygenase
VTRYCFCALPPCSTFVALAQSDELRLDHKLQPGDISLVNNLTLLHAKTAFKVG